jgi:hypothetical protein
MMRKLTVAMLIAAGIGLAGTQGAPAAPVNNVAVLGDIVNGMQPLEQAQHRRWGSGGHWRWGSRGGHGRWGSRPLRRCHRPFNSRMFPC